MGVIAGMSVKYGGFLKKALFIGLSCGLASLGFAAPQLRLSTTTVGPVFATQGQNGTQQSINALNIGDGALNLTASSDSTWTNVTFGAVRSCSGTPCVPVNVSLLTSQLNRGAYTATITLADPNAIDSPQTFTVTVQVGSAVPDSIDLYVAPAGTASTNFTTGSALTTVVSNPPGGATVSIAAPNVGSFASSYSYVVTAKGNGGGDADFQSTIGITGSGTPGDNKSLPVRVHVTTQPIASWSPLAVNFRIAQGAAPQTQYVSFTNTGQGALTLSNSLFGSVPSWLKASISGTFLVLTADPTGLNVGSTSATVTVNSNAKNAPANITVNLNVLNPGPPSVSFQGVVDNALFKAGDPVAPGGIIALFGEQLTTGAPAQAAQLPLGTSLGGATVLVNDNPVPVYYVSATQINFLMPYATPAGQARVKVTRDGQASNTVSVGVAAAAPRLMRLGIGEYGLAVLSDAVTFPIPTTAGLASRPAQVNEVVVFYALGLGQTNPPSQDGVAASAAQVPNVKMILGQSSLPTSGDTIIPDYAGLTPGLVGLYQINVRIPAAVPKGDHVSATLDMGGGVLSNRVEIAIR
jgi:uncharacterized protein (TIGR03437 family)